MRYARLCSLFGLILAAGAYAVEAPGVVINEIMYNTGSADPRDEFIEIYNNSTVAVELENWRFSKGVTFTFPKYTLNAGAYVVIAADLTVFAQKHAGITNVIGPWTGKLSNSREALEIEDSTGLNIDNVTYCDDGDFAQRAAGPNDQGYTGWTWASGHDGVGKSLELSNPSMPNQHGQNWRSSIADGGTPGAPNSVKTVNIAPLILNVQHFPVIPKSTDTVRVTARIIDEIDASATARVYYRLDGTTNFSFIDMFDDGLHGDAGVNDGFYGATLPMQANNAIVEYYVSATDSGTLNRTWPSPTAPTNQQLTNCLYQVDNTAYTGTQPLYKLIMTDAERQMLATLSGSTGSNAAMNGTFISVDGTGTELRYQVAIRNRGHGSRFGTPHNYRVNFPESDRWKGVGSININSRYTHNQYFGTAVAKKTGLATASAKVVQLRVNNTNLAPAGSPSYGCYVHCDTLDSDLIGKLYPNDSSGNLYKCVRLDDNSVQADLLYQGPDPTIYQLVYFKQTNTEENDFSDLIHLTEIINNSPAAGYPEAVAQIVDIDEWTRFFAYQSFLVNSESTLTNGVGDDYSIYIGTSGLSYLHAYDLDTVFGGGDTPGNTSESIWDWTQQLASINRMLKDPEIAPKYYFHLDQLSNTVFEPAAFNAFADQLMAGVFPTSVIDSIKNFNSLRRTSIRSQVPLNIVVTVAPAAQNGYPYTTSPSVSLGGFANSIRTRSVKVGGIDATWTAWQAQWSIANVPLQPGINRILIQSFDASNTEFERGFVDVWYDDSSVTLNPPIAGNTTLTAANGPYRFSGDLVVPVGATLTVQAGTSLYFDATFGIKVFGRIVAEGNSLSRIRMTRTPGSTGVWAGIVFTDSKQDNRLGYVDFEFADSSGTNVDVQDSTLSIDNTIWTNTVLQILNMEDSSVRLTNSYIPNTQGVEPVHMAGLPTNGYLIIDSNIFGTTSGYNDVCDLTGGNRPNSIMIITNNIFTGGSDDGLDLDGTDAHIEGNIFMHFHKNNTSNSDSHCITTGIDGTNTSELTICRNLFFDNDHALLCKQDGFLTVQNNTFILSTIAVLNFRDEQTTVPPPGPGKGAVFDGNIFYANNRMFDWLEASLDVTVKNSLVPTLDLGPFVDMGPGNIVADPQFAGTDFSLAPTSAARGTGPNGLDMGWRVPAGASISGEPSSPTAKTAATLTINGPGIVSYKWKLDNGAFSSETPLATPITLTNLPAGLHTVYVCGKNDAGVWQADAAATVSKPWTVAAPPIARVYINEILADNKAAVAGDGSYPDVIELYNDGSAIDLGDMSISDNPANPRKYVFPAGTNLGAGQYLLLYGDGAVSSPGLHIGFGVKNSGDSLTLYDTEANESAELDKVEFGLQLTDRSIGRRADGQWVLCVPTFGAANSVAGTGDPLKLKINEWLTAGQGQFRDDFIELYNPSGVPVPIGGMYLTDNTFTEPLKSRVPPLSFIGKFGVMICDGNLSAGADHVDFQLSSEQGNIGLYDTNGSRVDEVFYGSQNLDISQGRTPNGSLVIGNFPPTPGLDNPNPVGSVTVTKSNLVPITKVWKYFQSGVVARQQFPTVAFNDSAWPSGAALLYIEDAALPAPKNTALTEAQNCYYFRCHFTFSGDPTKVSLELNTVIDDGAVFYLNGAEVYRLGIDPNENPVGFDSPANRTVGDAAYEGPFPVPTTNLINGDNVLAVRVHQVNSGSTDIVFGMTLDAVTTVVTNNPLNPVVINEVSTRPTGAGKQFVEILNPTAAAANISGWYLSDDRYNPTKYKIPTTSAIAVGGFVTFDETQFGSKFHLNPLGGEIFIFSADAGGALTGYSNGFEYEASDAGVSFGRYTTSTGEIQYPALLTITQNAANTAPRVGPIVISEVMYNPVPGEDGFLELTNITGAPVLMYDLANPNNTWRVNAVGYSLPVGTVLPAGAIMIVSSSDPAVFRAKYNVPAYVQVVGPYSGSLDNDGEMIQLQKPDAPVLVDGSSFVPYITVDAVRYSDSSPWPGAPDGEGPSLERVSNTAYGNDVINWRSSVGKGGSPGNTNVWDGGGDGANWASHGNWFSNYRPIGSGRTAIAFPDVGLAAYTASNNISGPLDLNNLILNGNLNSNTITGQALNFTGIFPAIVQNGSKPFTVGNDLILASPLTIQGSGTGSLALNGVISGSNSITKYDASKAVFSGANTYSGGTIIEGGEISLFGANSTSGTGEVRINADGRLSGTGAAGATTVSAGGILAPGISGPGTLTLSSLDAQADSILEFDLGATSDLIQVNGNVNASGIVVLNPTGFVVGDYTLIQYTGTLLGNALVLDSNVPPFKYEFITAVVGKITLRINDILGPYVLSSVRNSPNPTGAPTVDYFVTFNRNVTGVDAADFAVTVVSGTVAGASVAQVTSISASKYLVAVNSGSGEGVIRLDVIDDDSIKDDTNTPMGEVGAGNGNFTRGETYTLDHTPPAVTVEQAANQSDPTQFQPLNFTVIFNEAVVDFSDSKLVVGGTASGATAAIVSSAGNKTFAIAVSGLQGDGTVTLSVAAGSVHDNAQNGNLASTSADNTVTFAIPNRPKVSLVSTTTPNATYGVGDLIDVAVTFDKSVTVTGTPRINLNSSGTAYAEYRSGSGSTKLSFLYTVAAGETSADLDYRSTTSLVLNGGTIRGAGSLDADIKLPAPGGTGSLGAAANIVIDTKPVITSIAPLVGSTAGGTLVTLTGKNLTGGTVTFGGTAGIAPTSTATQIQVTTPPHAAGIVDVTVTAAGGSVTSVGAFEFNTPPAFTSAPVVSPASPIQGRPVTVTISAEDADGDTFTITYAWGDGTTSTTATHIYTVSGPYTITISVSDGINPPVTTSIPITVNPAVPYTATKLACAFSFIKKGADTCQLTGVLPNLPAALVLKDKTILVDIGGAVASFTLDAKGKGKSAAGTIALKTKFLKTGGIVGGPVQFTTKYKGDFVAAWRDEGVNPDVPASKAPIFMVTNIELNGTVFSAKIPCYLTSAPHKSGKIVKQ